MLYIEIDHLLVQSCEGIRERTHNACEEHDDATLVDAARISGADPRSAQAWSTSGWPNCTSLVDVADVRGPTRR